MGKAWVRSRDRVPVNISLMEGKCTSDPLNPQKFVAKMLNCKTSLDGEDKERLNAIETRISQPDTNYCNCAIEDGQCLDVECERRRRQQREDVATRLLARIRVANARRTKALATPTKFSSCALNCGLHALLPVSLELTSRTSPRPLTGPLKQSGSLASAVVQPVSYYHAGQRAESP
jgi:hypothetical protein